MKIYSLNILFIYFIKSVIAENKTVLDDSIYKTDSVLYTAKNDIVDIHYSIATHNTIFVVERKLSDGSYKGLFALENARGDDKTLIATKVLGNGQCSTSDNETVYFGASDGIYTYNFQTKKAERYGNITADVKGIQKDTNNDLIYVIANNKLNKVTEKGMKMKEIELVNDVQEIVLDKYNNVYLFEKRNKDAKLFEEMYSKPKVIVGDKVIDVKGLPDKYNHMKLTKSIAATEGAILILDNQLYRIFLNGSCEATEYIFDKTPTAYYFDLGVFIMFGHDQKLYQFNILSIVLHGLKSGIGNFLKSLYINN